MILMIINYMDKLHIIQNYFRDYLSSIDPICFQETKLKGTNLQDISKITRLRANFYGVEAKVAYNHNILDRGVGSGCLYTSPWLISVPGDDVGLLNVFAPHSSSDMCIF